MLGKESDQYAALTTIELEVQRNRFFVGMCIALLAAATSVIACVLIITRVQVVPAMVWIDSKNGLITRVESGESLKNYTADQAVQMAMAREYVWSRENYGGPDQNSRAKKVTAMSMNSVKSEYDADHDKVNPSSIVNLFKDGGRREIEIRNVVQVPADPESFQVTYLRRDIHPGKTEEQEWTATLSVTFSDKDMEQSDRLLNPLNFRVKQYRLDRVLGQ